MLLVTSNKLLHCLWPTCKRDFRRPWPNRGSGLFDDVSGHGMFERLGGFFGQMPGAANAANLNGLDSLA